MTSVSNQSNYPAYAQSPSVKIKRFKVNSKSTNKQITAIHLPSAPKILETEQTCLSAQKDKLMKPPAKPLRKINPNQMPSKLAINNNTSRSNQVATLIQVNGVRYSVSENGHKLKRLPAKGLSIDTSVDDHAKSSIVNSNKTQPPAESTDHKKDDTIAEDNVAKTISKKKFYLEGEEYVEDEPGILIRSRNSMTRASITNYKSRSINTILKSM